MSYANRHLRSRYHLVYGEMQSSSTGPDEANQRRLRQLHFERQQRQQQRSSQAQQQPSQSSASSSRTAGNIQQQSNRPATSSSRSMSAVQQQSPPLVPPGAPRIPYVQPARISRNQRASQPPQPARSTAGSARSTSGFQQQPSTPPPGAPRAGYLQPARNNQQPPRQQPPSSSSKSSTTMARTQANVSQILHQAASQQAQRLPNLGQAEVECYVCLDNFSPRDTIACQSNIKKHYICKPCAKEYVTAQVGDQKFAILCGGEKCSAALPKNLLVAILDAKTLQRWEIIVTQRTLQLAKIPGLEQCPFCEFQCVLPSVSEAPVFVCQKCGKVSCRMCKKEEHPMRKCEEVAGKDSKGKEKSVVEKARQELEEALSEALIQRCSKCRTKFVKEYGCNEMKCPNCKNLQCYICGKDINEEKGDHFGANKPCQMFDNTAKQEDRKVKAAEAAAIKKLLAKYPTLKASDLKINFSKRVEDAEKQRQKDWEHPENLIERGYIEGEVDGEVHTASGVMRNPFTVHAAPRGRVNEWYEWEDVTPVRSTFGRGNTRSTSSASVVNDIEEDRRMAERLAEQLWRQDLMDQRWFDDEAGPSGSSGSRNSAQAESSRTGASRERQRQRQNQYGYGHYGYDPYAYGGGYGWY